MKIELNAVNVAIILLLRQPLAREKNALRFIVYISDQKIQSLLSINYISQIFLKKKLKYNFTLSLFKGVALSLVWQVCTNLKNMPFCLLAQCTALWKSLAHLHHG